MSFSASSTRDSSARPAARSSACPEGSLEHWLTERYCLYARDAQGTLWVNDVHHAPWPLQKAEAEIRVNTMLMPHQLSVPDVPPLLHFAKRVDVVVWSGERVR